MSIKPLHQYPQHPMTDELSQQMLMLTFNSMRPEFSAQVEADLASDMLFCMIRSRAAYHDLLIEVPAVLAIAVISEGNPGRVVQLLHSMASVTPVDQTVTLGDFFETFGMGFPSEDDWVAAWDAQKADNGTNRLDDKSEWTRP